MTRSLGAVFALVAAVGCYSPDPQAGSSCATGPCPTGLVCSPATETCELVAIDARTPDAPEDSDVPFDGPPLDGTPDAPPDAVPVMARLHQQGAAMTDLQIDSLALTLPGPTRVGNVLVMIGATPSGALVTVAGGGVSTWTRAARSTTHLNIEIWYGVVTLASTDPVEITRAGSMAPLRMWVGEWSGLAVPVILDAANASSGELSPAMPPPITTSASGRDLVFLAVADGIPNDFGQPTQGPWVELLSISSASTSQSQWYRFVTGSATQTPTVSETSHQWDAALAAFRTAN